MSSLDQYNSSGVDRVIAQIDEAVTAKDSESICAQIKAVLEQAVNNGEVELAPSMVTPVGSGYGRHLLHRDPAGRYTIVVMCWGPKQGTPIHDHSGLWCVECVVKGKIRVDSYQLLEDSGADTARFEQEAEVFAGVGEAGALIPPFEYHVIENPFDEVAVTMHVYGGEMETCNVFTAETEGSDRYRRQVRPLSYSG